MRHNNTAQGDFIVLGAFGAIAALAALGPLVIAPHLALVVVALLLLPIAFLGGYALQRYVLNGTLGRDPLPSLVVTFGLAIVIQNGLQQVFSADPRSLDAGSLASRGASRSAVPRSASLPLAIFGVALAARRRPAMAVRRTRSDGRSARCRTTARSPN